MAIRLTCPCGKNLQVGKDLAGKRTRCPGCNQVLSVPERVETEGYALVDETHEERQERIDSQRREDTQEEPDEAVERKTRAESAPGRKKPASWVPAVCYKCDASEKCKRCLFYSGKKYSVEKSHDCNYEYTRTTYRDVQNHEIFLCRPCAVAGWKKYYLRHILIAAGCEAGIMAFVLAVIVQPRSWASGGATVVLLLGLLLSIVPALFVVLSLMKIRNPTFKHSVMGSVAIGLARREIARHTGSDSFFTTSEMDEMHYD